MQGFDLGAIYVRLTQAITNRTCTSAWRDSSDSPIALVIPSPTTVRCFLPGALDGKLSLRSLCTNMIIIFSNPCWSTTRYFVKTPRLFNLLRTSCLTGVVRWNGARHCSKCVDAIWIESRAHRRTSLVRLFCLNAACSLFIKMALVHLEFCRNRFIAP